MRVTEALKRLAKISLWQDKYPDGPDRLTDEALSLHFTPDDVRAARASLSSPQAPVAWQQRERKRNNDWSDWYPSNKECYDEFQSGIRFGRMEYEVRALVVAPPVVPVAAKAEEGWIEATGTNPFQGQPVWEIRHRDGSVKTTREPWNCAWQHLGLSDDIVAYRQRPTTKEEGR